MHVFGISCIAEPIVGAGSAGRLSVVGHTLTFFIDSQISFVLTFSEWLLLTSSYSAAPQARVELLLWDRNTCVAEIT